ncbi:MAG: TolC family protein [Candidatus Dactylopiibacterium sp.]|nr:TolC family protein [Candidatus Dactylopiibacterium sp.]
MPCRPSRMVWLCAALAGPALPAFAFASPPAATAAQAPLNLAAALDLAERRAPQLAASAAREDAAREMRVPAGRLPDPLLKLGVQNVPTSGEMAGSLTRDGMTMRTVGVMQELTLGDKRAARVARAEREADAAHAATRLTLATLRRDTTLAWLELAYQDTVRALIAAQVDELGRQAQAAEAAFRGGRGTQGEILAMRLEAGRMQDELAAAERDLALARSRLARWIGADASRPPGPLPAHDRLAWQPAATPAAAGDARHPLIAASLSEAALGDADARLARAMRQPDPAIEFMYGARGSGYPDMVSVSVTLPLPWDRANRQDRDLAASLARRDAARAMAADTAREYAARVEEARAAWEADQARERHYDATLLPLAQARIDAALAAYRAGTGSLAEVLGARRARLDTQLARQRTALAAARGHAELDYLDPRAGLPGAAQEIQP